MWAITTASQGLHWWKTRVRRHCWDLNPGTAKWDASTLTTRLSKCFPRNVNFLKAHPITTIIPSKKNSTSLSSKQLRNCSSCSWSRWLAVLPKRTELTYCQGLPSLGWKGWDDSSPHLSSSSLSIRPTQTCSHGKYSWLHTYLSIFLLRSHLPRSGIFFLFFSLLHDLDKLVALLRDSISKQDLSTLYGGWDH